MQLLNRDWFRVTLNALRQQTGIATDGTVYRLKKVHSRQDQWFLAIAQELANGGVNPAAEMLQPRYLVRAHVARSEEHGAAAT